MAEIERLGWDDVIIKPVVDLGARNLVRVPREHVLAMLGRYEVSVMAQPFLPEVAGEGELSLVYIAGELSHGVRKLPARGDFRVQPQYGGTHEAVQPSAEATGIAERRPRGRARRSALRAGRPASRSSGEAGPDRARADRAGAVSRRHPSLGRMRWPRRCSRQVEAASSGGRPGGFGLLVRSGRPRRRASCRSSRRRSAPGP